MGKVIMIASGKGGTGKTSVCAGVSSALAVAGAKVLAVDADAGLRNLDIVLGMTDQLLFSFADVAMGRGTLDGACVSHPLMKNLFLLTAPSAKTTETLELSKLEEMFLSAREKFDYIVIDCPAGIGEDIRMLASVSDAALIVCTPDDPSLRGAEKIADELYGRGLKEVRLIVNRIKSRLIREGFARNLDDAIDKTGVALLGIIPDDDRIIACGNTGQPVILKAAGKVPKAYRNIARRLCGKRVPLMKL